MNDRVYVKLFSRIVTSSLWCEDSDTRVVWVTMLALANEYGEVAASIPGLARAANVPREKCESALNKFLAPDPDSRTKDHEGRRLETIDGGWHILNYELYRRMMSLEERREYKRLKEAERRQKLKDVRGQDVDTRGQTVDNHGQTVDFRGQISADADADGHGDAETETQKQSTSPPVAVSESHSDYSADFEQFWQAYPRKVGKGGAYKAWQHAKDRPCLACLLEVVKTQSNSKDWRKDGGQFIPHPATWLNQRRWEDGDSHTTKFDTQDPEHFNKQWEDFVHKSNFTLPKKP